MDEDNEENIFPLPVYEVTPDPYFKYSANLHKVPIIIDNGSYQCKVGWACQEEPALIFRNHIAKHRGKKENETQIGNDIKNIEVIRWLLKTQFDRNVITQFDVQEIIFDHIFSHLGINTEGRVEHPIVLTEPLCNPNYSRQLMSELLFECYQVPSVAYGVDALFSLHHYRKYRKALVNHGIILNLGYNTTHAVPFVNDKVDIENCHRINVGGQHMVSFLHRVLQLKYPSHATSVTPSRAESLLHHHMYFSQNFCEELREWEKDDFAGRNTHNIQLPFAPVQSSSAITGSGKFEKCNSILRQVQGIKIKRRAERLAYYDERLQELQSVQELLEDDDDEAILALQELGYSTGSELQAGIKELNCKIKRIRDTISVQQSDEIVDSPLKGWCDELNLFNFNDVESWIESIKHKKKELKENPLQTNFENRNADLSGFSFSRALDMIGGLHELCGPDQSYTDHISKKEERKEHLEILTEIIDEYDAQFSNIEHSYASSSAGFHQLHLGVERIRIPEIIMQPSILGIEQAGLAEGIDTILRRYPSTQQQQIVENVLITGGCAQIPGIKERIEAELMAMRPFQSKFHVHQSDKSFLDAWKGAKLWSTYRNNLSRHSISRAEYDEKGGDYLKEHSLSNVYFPTPQGCRKSLSVMSEPNNQTKTEGKT